MKTTKKKLSGFACKTVKLEHAGHSLPAIEGRRFSEEN